MNFAKNFLYSRKTQRIHDAIAKHIAAAPYNMVIHLRRPDFELLRGTAMYPWMRTKEVLDYDGVYQVKVQP